MKWPVVAAVLLAVSCGPGQVAYQEGARSLAPEVAHPLYTQLLPVMGTPEGSDPDNLIRTWKTFLGDAPLPLRSENRFTFVYYDFSHALRQVFLEASFAPGRQEALTRVGETSLFARVYLVPKPNAARYRFTDGKTPLVDPFHAEVDPGDDFWQPLVSPTSEVPSTEWIAGASETALVDQDVTLLLPPSYRMNLAETYPLVVVAGQEGRAWIKPLSQLMEEGSIRPVIVAAVGPTEGLKSRLEDRVVPFLRQRYRASPLAADLVLVGWGAMAKPAQETAASRPDFWTKTWIAPADQARNVTAWNTLAPPVFRTNFAVVAP